MDEAMSRPYKYHIFRGGLWRHPSLEMLFLGVSDAMSHSWKWPLFFGMGEEWPAPKNIFLGRVGCYSYPAPFVGTCEILVRS